jgi:hypothetical protein
VQGTYGSFVPAYALDAGRCRATRASATQSCHTLALPAPICVSQFVADSGEGAFCIGRRRPLSSVVGAYMYDQVTPGSAVAIAEGCICDPVANNDGLGSARFSGRVVFVPHEQCPLHGSSVLKRHLTDHLSKVAAAQRPSKGALIGSNSQQPSSLLDGIKTNGKSLG